MGVAETHENRQKYSHFNVEVDQNTQDAEGVVRRRSCSELDDIRRKHERLPDPEAKAGNQSEERDSGLDEGLLPFLKDKTDSN